MKKELADLNIKDGEEEGLILPTNGISRKSIYDCGLVGCFLTASVVHFPVMKEMMTNIWHPLGEVQILDLDGKWYLFKLFHELDIERVIMSAPWTFNNHLLVFHQLKVEEDPMEVPLISSAFWIKVHYLPLGFFSKSMVKLFGDFIGEFIDYDMKQLNREMKIFFISGDLMRGELRMSINPILGFNLERCKIQAKNANAAPSNEMDHVIMEDNPIENGDGKKRPRFDNMDLGVSVLSYLIRPSLERINAQIQQRLAATTWKVGTLIQLRSYSKNHVYVTIKEGDDSPEWRMMAFYGALDLREKEETWNLLRREERRNMVYTGKRNLLDTNIREKLDRSVANTNRMNLFLDFS
ncbi:hypothetical protein Goshw_002569, partial [Gossypium schwendimanii]|nr:hypothetical protein [Gossypium schwendimanii]